MWTAQGLPLHERSILLRLSICIYVISIDTEYFSVNESNARMIDW